MKPNNPLDQNPLQLPLVRGRARPAPPLTRGGWEGFELLALAIALTIATSTGMARAASHEHENHHDTATQQAAATHTGTGVLKAVNAKDGKVQIAHEPIAALNWPPMTMWFALRDPLPYDLKAGDAVRFELMQDEKKQWMIVKIGRK